MIDYYHREKMMSQRMTEAVKAAARERLDAEAKATRRAAQRSPGWSLAAVLRALAFTGSRPLRIVTARRTVPVRHD